MPKRHKTDHVPPADRRTRFDLDLFVLMCIEHDVNTAYMLHSTAGLSLGAINPAFNRLEEAEYIRRGKLGSRGRTEYEVTAKGSRYLENGWRALLDAPDSGDTESILRIATVALLSGANRKIVSGYLRAAAATRTAGSNRRRQEAEQVEASATGTFDTSLYRWMQATQAAARLASEAAVLHQLAAAISRRI